MNRREWPNCLSLCFCLVLFWGCKQEPKAPTPRVTDIRIASQIDRSAAERQAPSEIDTASLVRAAETGLGASAVQVALSPTVSTNGDFVLQIEVGLMYAAPTKAKVGKLRALAVGSLRSRRNADLLADDKTVPLELTRLQHVAMAEKDADAQPFSQAVWRDLSLRIVKDAAASLGAQLRLGSLPVKDLVHVTEDRQKEPELRGVALRLLAMRKNQDAQKLAMAVLKERDSPSALRDQAIGALIEIGDPAAVRPLLDSTEFADRNELGKVLEAAAALGGDEAQRYLEFVAQSHSDLQIRQEAKQALAHLLAKRDRNVPQAGSASQR